jgi:hypothetical protein
VRDVVGPKRETDVSTALSLVTTIPERADTWNQCSFEIQDRVTKFLQKQGAAPVKRYLDRAKDEAATASGRSEPQLRESSTAARLPQLTLPQVLDYKFADPAACTAACLHPCAYRPMSDLAHQHGAAYLKSILCPDRVRSGSMLGGIDAP